MDVETYSIEDLEFFVAFDALEAIEDGLLKTLGAFGGEFEALMEIFDRNSNRGILIRMDAYGGWLFIFCFWFDH